MSISQRLLLLTPLLLVALVVSLATIGGQISLVRKTNSSFGVQDFAFQAVLFSSFCEAKVSSPYVPGEQKKGLDAYFQTDFKAWMPVGLSPAAILPLCGLWQLLGANLKMLVVAWTLLSVFLLSMALYRTDLQNLSAGREAFVLACLTVFVSEATLRTILLGQSSMLFLAGLVSLTLVSDAPQQAKRFAAPLLWSAAFVLKPTYFLIYCVSLAGRRSLAQVLLGLLMPAVLAALACLYFGAGIWPEYFDGLATFVNGMPEYYLASFSESSFVTFRSVTHGFVADPLAVGVSKLSLALCFLIGLVLAIKRRDNQGVYLPIAEILVLGALLLFSPYSGAYEDILILFPLLTLILHRSVSKAELVSLCFFSLLVLNFSLLPENLHFIAWLAKLYIFGFVLVGLSGQTFEKRIEFIR